MKPMHIMIFIRQILNKIMPKESPIILGRWRIEKCNNKISNKIDLSNEDHCGPCGQYNLNKIALTNNNNTNAHLEKKNYFPNSKGEKALK